MGSSSITAYDHLSALQNVVLVSFWINRRFHLGGADETALAVGGFLHDFYLYDWHKTSSLMGCAVCSRCTAFPPRFRLCEREALLPDHQEARTSSSHMWPLTFRHVPTCREAVIVCLADKYCAVVESMFRRAKAAATVGADETDETLW